MVSPEESQAISDARKAIEDGNNALAQSITADLLSKNPESLTGLVLSGIALSQGGRVKDADNEFEKAIAMAPQDANAAFNYAVHLSATERPELARSMAYRVLQLDPNHAGAKQIASDLVSTEPVIATGLAKEVETPSAESAPVEAALNPNAETHLIKWVADLGAGWDVIGWLLVGISAVLFIAAVFLMAASIMQSGTISIMDLAKQQPPSVRLLLQVNLVFPYLSAFWMILDILDKKGNFLWLAPMVLLCLLQIQFLYLPIYIVVERNRTKSLRR